MGKIDKAVIRTVLILIVMFLFFSSIARVAQSLYNIDASNLAGFLAVLVTSIYFTSITKKPVQYMQSIKFALVLFIMRFVDFFTFSLLSNMTGFATTVAMFLTVFLILDTILFTVISHVYLNMAQIFSVAPKAGSRKGARAAR